MEIRVREGLRQVDKQCGLNVMYTQDTPLSQLTVGEFQTLLGNSCDDAPDAKAPKQYIYGIGGLARLLDCSNVTAQKIKNSGKIPYTQVGRKIIFDKQAVIKALEK